MAVGIFEYVVSGEGVEPILSRMLDGQRKVAALQESPNRWRCASGDHRYHRLRATALECALTQDVRDIMGLPFTSIGGSH